jgi:hypothetical protein
MWKTDPPVPKFPAGHRGNREDARRSYRAAARRTTSLPEQRYFEARAARLNEGMPPA